MRLPRPDKSGLAMTFLLTRKAEYHGLTPGYLLCNCEGVKRPKQSPEI